MGCGKSRPRRSRDRDRRRAQRQYQSRSRGQSRSQSQSRSRSQSGSSRQSDESYRDTRDTRDRRDRRDRSKSTKSGHDDLKYYCGSLKVTSYEGGRSQSQTRPKSCSRQRPRYPSPRAPPVQSNCSSIDIPIEIPCPHRQQRAPPTECCCDNEESDRSSFVEDQVTNEECEGGVKICLTLKSPRRH